MTKKCVGCGSVMQSKYPLKQGYVEKKNYDTSNLCQRCFKIKNYGDYKEIDKDIKDYQKMFDRVKNKKDLVLFLCDIFNLDETIKKINELSGRVILVITKFDLLPKSVKEEKIIRYIKSNYKLNVLKIILISSNKSYNLDKLYQLINEYKKSDKVYLVGNTNSGKSTLINKLMMLYGDCISDVTTSYMPNTTLGFINAKVNDDLTLIDSPGIVNLGNYLLYLDSKAVKKLSCKTRIKPRTYQMKPNQSIIIEDYVRIDYLSDHNNSFTFYISNDVKIKRINLNTNNYLRDLNKKEFDIKDHEDIVISGICFCKIVDKATINVYANDKVKIFVRKNLI